MTPRQLSLLDAIHAHFAAHRVSPTLRELGKQLDINRVTVHEHARKLINGGYLREHEPRVARSLRLTRKGRSVVESSSAHLVVRKKGVLCTRCGKTDPVHPGDGTPMPAFLTGLHGCLARHPSTGECA